MTMRVEIWSDVVCPWCGLGQARLDKAIERFGRDRVALVHRSFQLDPTFPAAARPVREYLAAKYRLGEGELVGMFARIEGLAAQEGIVPYRVGDNRIGNTRLAHGLLAMAKDKGLEDRAWKHLYRVYFGEGRSIFEREALVAIGVELGMDATEVDTALGEGRYRAAVEADVRAARTLGVSGVPFVLVQPGDAAGKRYGVSGAQEVATFVRALETAAAEGSAQGS